MSRHTARILLLIASMLYVSVFRTVGQDVEYDYYFNAAPSTAGPEWGELSPEDYFYMPLERTGSIFDDLSRFNFSTVRYSRRGYPIALSHNEVSAIDLSGGITASTEYWMVSALRRARIVSQLYPERFLARNTQWITDVSNRMILTTPRIDRHSATLFATNRRARIGGRLYSAGYINPLLSYSAMAYRRWGRDSAVDGAFTDETSYFLQLEHSLGDGHTLNVAAMGSFSKRGLRSAATREAFELTGDNHYNPSWGYYNGDERNSRVAGHAQNMVLLSYMGQLTPSTLIDASAAYRFGTRRISSLGWRNAMNPYADYYRYMPSWAENPDAERIIRQAWESGDPSVRHIDWNELCRRNLSTADSVGYYLEDRIERIGDLQVVVSGFTHINSRANVGYGIRLRSEDTRRYKEMKDRLEGAPYYDLDPYLSGAGAANDLRNPGRLVGNGDRFGYDYNMQSLQYSAYAQAAYEAGRYAVSGSVEVGRASLRRKGNYEKAAYPGASSYGKSEKQKFDTYTVSAAMRLSLSPRHFLMLSGSATAQAPRYGNVFLSPDFNNAVIDGATEMKIYDVEAEYTAVFNRLRIEAKAYLTATSDETAVYRYYDDIASEYYAAAGAPSPYSDMVLTGIDKRYMGIEIGASFEFTHRLSLRVAGAAGRNEYRSNPDVEILYDATLQPHVTGSRSYLKGYRIGGSPETVISAELRYRNRGWLASVTANHMSGRHIAPTPLRRMERAYKLAGAPDLFDSFVGQEKLGGMTTIDLFVMKSFDIYKHHRLSVLLSVNNLLNKDDAIYDGYELMRVGKRGRGVNSRFAPFDSKYTYGYGRTWYASLTYSF